MAVCGSLKQRTIIFRESTVAIDTGHALNWLNIIQGDFAGKDKSKTWNKIFFVYLSLCFRDRQLITVITYLVVRFHIKEHAMMQEIKK